MTRPKVWKVLPAFEQSISKTFLGLDKNNSHTFKISESLNDDFIRYFGLREGKLSVPVIIRVKERDYPAKIRWARMNRTKPVKLKPSDLSVRDGIFFEWASDNYQLTQNIMYDIFRNQIKSIISNDSVSLPKFRFHHLEDNVFLFVVIE